MVSENEANLNTVKDEIKDCNDCDYTKKSKIVSSDSKVIIDGIPDFKNLNNDITPNIRDQPINLKWQNRSRD